MRLYTASAAGGSCRRLCSAPGVLAHLWRHGRRFDAVHTASFPYFSLLAAAAVRRRGGYQLVVDWHEVWTRRNGIEHRGRRRSGRLARLQCLCARLGAEGVLLLQLHALRLRAEGLRGEVTVLRGEYAGPVPTVVDPQGIESQALAGRMIPEKRAIAVAAVIARARARMLELRATLLGDGPERDAVLRAIESPA